MPAISNFYSLLEIINQKGPLGRKFQVSGSSLALIQMFILSLILKNESRHIVVILPTVKDVSFWSRFLGLALEAFPAFLKLKASVLPFTCLYGSDRFVNSTLNRKSRIKALSMLAEDEGKTVIVTTLQGLMQTTLCKDIFLKSSMTFQKGMECDQDAAILRFEDLGYTSSVSVDEPGHFAVRGGIVDIFPVNAEFPIRLEWSLDRLSSIRQFNVTDQRSIQLLESQKIVPAYESLTPRNSQKDDAQRLFNVLLEQNIKSSDRDGMVSQLQLGLKFPVFDMFSPLFRPGGKKATALDYLDPDSTLLFPLSEESVHSKYHEFLNHIEISYKRDLSEGKPVLPLNSHFLVAEETRASIEKKYLRVEFANPFAEKGVELFRYEGRITFEGAPSVVSGGADIFEKWVEIIVEMTKKRNFSVVIFAHYEERFNRIENLFKHRSIALVRETFVLNKIVNRNLSPGNIYLSLGDITGHFFDSDSQILILSEEALFGIKPRSQRGVSQQLKSYLSSFADLKSGDLVVHVQHGIGRYLGLTTLSVAGITSDFLVIEYAGHDKIYLPIDRLSLLQRYSVGGDGNEIGNHSLDRLGGGFEKKKNRVQKAVRDMAEELIKIQAKRSLAKGIHFSLPDDTYLQFEGSFSYEETEDQIRALQDVEADLLSGRPMDRLVCGDVGFGKTEIALRATMRCVLEGFQVLVLVPTTILCFQHFRTFRDRLSPFGVKVGQINRFVKSDTVRSHLTELQSGTLDVLVGTHRLLSKDIIPKRLGLLVIDEEQRFGVSHKERLKTLRADAHVLTLTATPIPRTLHMAMVGLRAISVIATPPHDRLSVKTYISTFNESLIKEAIEQEIRRGGQVFFVHNRVEDIDSMRFFLEKLVPGIEVRVGHGQMPEHQLEKVIIDFLEGRFQVLVCTTIIESGVDMPHVNTLIVNRADHFGLSQLYQLRGRVGRSNIQAYAYFLTAPVHQVSEEAQKRLDVLAAHQELGAGFHIASHDLELRGAGHLLGDAQSGHAAEVGLELYTDLLKRAIEELNGGDYSESVDAEIRIPVSAIIPEFYVQSESQRLQLYKRLFGTQTEAEILQLRREMLDRFGELPDQCLLLLKIARLKQSLGRIGAVRLTAGRDSFELRFGRISATQVDRLLQVVREQPQYYRVGPDNRLFLNIAVPERPNLFDQDRMIQQIESLIDPLVS